MAITLTHWRDHCRLDCDCVVQNGIRLTNTCDDACDLTGKYLKGKELPNYPVPAIRLSVTLDYEFIAIWQVGKRLAYYHDDYETVFAY